MKTPSVVNQEQWLEARLDLLAKEKEFTRQRDALTEARQRLPMVKVDKEYTFDGPHGPVSLGDLFEDRRQLIVYHFMLAPDWEAGCKSCSFVMDNLAEGLIHLTARDTSFAAVSLAPIARIEAFKKRMQWTFPWVSSFRNTFNCDYHVTIDPSKGSGEYNYQSSDIRGEMPGLSVFFRHKDQILHSYSTYARGLDIFLSTYHLLDVTPLGRQEGREIMTWIRHHDRYPTSPKAVAAAPSQCGCRS